MKVEILAGNVIQLINEEEQTGIVIAKATGKIIFTPINFEKDNDVFIQENNLMYVTVYLFFSKIKEALKCNGTLTKNFIKERKEIVLRNCDGAMTNRIVIRKEPDGFQISLKNIEGARVVVSLNEENSDIIQAFQDFFTNTVKKVRSQK